MSYFLLVYFSGNWFGLLGLVTSSTQGATGQCANEVQAAQGYEKCDAQVTMARLVSLYLPEVKPASGPLDEASLGCRLETHTCVGKVHEGDAAFGCLAELAARRGSAAMTTAPQEDLTPSPPSSLTRRIVVPAELCKPPYSREWLLAHREHCGGSPLRPGAFAARVVPTGERACSSGCGSTSCGEEPLPRTIPTRHPGRDPDSRRPPL